MNLGESLLVPIITRVLAAVAVGLLGGCLGPPDLDAGSDPLLVTESGAPRIRTPERAAAIAEMRARAEAAETAPYPDAFQSAQTSRLATREEPRSVSAAESIEAELAAIARRRQSATAPADIAAFDAREAELRRLAARARARSPRL